jgi:hypothetical protein
MGAMPLSHNFKLEHLKRPGVKAASASCCLCLSTCAAFSFSATALAGRLATQPVTH